MGPTRRVTLSAAIVATVAAVSGAVWFVWQATAAPAMPLSAAFESLGSFQYDPPEPGTYALPPIKEVPAGELIDHNAKPVALKQLLRGKYSLVSFVYLNCRDTEGCPLAMSTLWQLHGNSKKLPALQKDLQLITISFDPQRDTPEKLKVIADTMQADNDIADKLKWHLLTSDSPSAVAPVLAGFGQTINRTSDPTIINHLLRLYLVDRQGSIRNIYGLGSIDPRLIITDVQTLLMQETQDSQS